ncbi:MAG: PIG-L family deacetylase [Verrucomicrobiae bacterium]|nr:PIG-L family deacetylase [Verrucomicrobiae bacterium]
MSTPYHQLVANLARLIHEAKTYPLGGFAPLPPPAPAPNAPKALIFSPHPDDEVIIGGLALRLLRESGWRIINVAVTQGSNKARQAARWEELKQCCAHIGFELLQTAPHGLEKINPRTRAQDPRHWQQCVAVIVQILQREQPRVIFFPHDADWNSTHIGVHHLVVDALRSLPAFTCEIVETEYWAPMASPNLMVEISPTDLGDLIAALTFHVGEVQRNPYHLSLPAWMMDNVRRGGEVVGGQGGAAPPFTFATLYRVRTWRESQWQPRWEGGRFLSLAEKPHLLFGA